MYTYNDLYQTCDRILELFVTLRPRLTDGEIYKELKTKTLSEIISALQELDVQKCITKEKTYAENAYSLLGFGRQVFDKGGFKEYLKELNRKEELKELIDQSVLQTNKSVVDTNKTVQKNATTQERLTTFALIIAGIGAIVPLITLIKDTMQPTQLIDTETKQIMKAQQKSIDSLEQSLKSIENILKGQKNASYLDTASTKTKTN